MGLKDHAKALMEKAGVPVVPGYHGERQDAKFLKEKAYEVGYPVLIKPAAGGGGRGLRRVDKHAEFEAALEGAIREAGAAFGSSRVLIEKYIASPRHIEIQVFADGHGNVIHLGERDCSLQRRHQKVIEEAPAPGMTAELRAKMGAAAVEAAKAVGYVGAGTVEFVADGTKGLRADAFWFIEMNTRLQVEHPVTEAVTGLDLVEWQFRVAAGEQLPLAQQAVRFDGHAIEARIYAEDPENGFLPSTGPIVALQLPDDVRVDAGVEAGDEVTPYYDAMIAKLIAHAPTREAALDRLAARARSHLDRRRAEQRRVPRRALPGCANSGRAKSTPGLSTATSPTLGAVPHPFRSRRRGARRCSPARKSSAGFHVGRRNAAAWRRHCGGFAVGGARRLSTRRQALAHACRSSSTAKAVIATVAYGKGGMHIAVDGAAPASDAQYSKRAGMSMSCATAARPAFGSRISPRRPRKRGPATASIKAPMHGRVLELLVAARRTRRRRSSVSP